MENIKYGVRLGDIIHFWLDRWVGDNTLAVQFLDLFRCAKENEGYILTHFEWLGNPIIWCPDFSRSLMEQEEAQFIRLLNLLNETPIQERGRM